MTVPILYYHSSIITIMVKSTNNNWTFQVLSALSGLGIVTNNSDVHANAAPITSNIRIFVIFIKEMKRAASAGPAMNQQTSYKKRRPRGFTSDGLLH